MMVSRGDYRISTEHTALDLEFIHGYLTTSYWAKGVPIEVVAKSLEHSLNFGLLTGSAQVGFARVVTDFATFMYLADVFILEEHRGQGLAVWLIDTVIQHPDLQGLRTSLLKTADAHGLYEKFGFEIPEHCERWMERRVPYPYKRPSP
jgi:GNAT superfamily N-acetyltransferase